jgi:hypothetical protein
MKITTELHNAIKDGYFIAFQFLDGHVCACSNPNERYFISKVAIDPRPCLLTQTIIYRIMLPNGIKGFAILDFQEDDCSLY